MPSAAVSPSSVRTDNRPIAVVLIADAAADGLVDDVNAVLPADTSPIEWIRWPLLKTRLIDDGSVASSLRRLGDYRWVFAPSPTAVLALVSQLKRLGLDWPPTLRAALTGPGSAATLRRVAGAAADLVTPAGTPWDATHLLEAVARADADFGTARVLVANRAGSQPSWLAELKARAGGVDVVAVFDAETIGPPLGAVAEHQRWQAQGRSVHWVAGSLDQVERLAAWLSAADPLGKARSNPLFVPHDRIAEKSRALGFTNAIVFDDRNQLARGLQSGAESFTPQSVQTPSIDRSPVQPASSTPSPSTASKDAPEEAAAGSAPVDAGRSDAEPVIPEGTSRAADDANAQSLAGATAAATAVVPVGPAIAPITAEATPEATAPATDTSRDGATGPVADSASLASAARPAIAAGRTESALPPPPAPPPVPPVTTARSGTGWWPLLLLLVIAGLAFGGWWLMQQRFLDLERDGARRVQDAESRVARMEQQLKSLQDNQGQIASRSGQLEAKIAQSADQQEHLQSLYDELAKSRGDTVLVETEQSVVAAIQYLNLNGNVEAALMSLQTALGRMGDEADGERIGIRRLLAQDIERLKGLPAVDLAGAAGRLDGVISRTDRLPLLSDAALPQTDTANRLFGPVVDGSAAPASSAAPSNAAPAAATSDPAVTTTPAAPATTSEAIWARIQHWFGQIGLAVKETVGSAREEFRKVVSIQRVDNPDSLLLTPEQRDLVRGNLRLRLLNARLNLLNREEALFRQDLGRAIEDLGRWFDPSSRDVQASITTLRELQGVPLTVKAPDLGETLATVRQARAASESRR